MILLSFLQNLNILPCEHYEHSDYYEGAEYCHLGCKHCYNLTQDYAEDDFDNSVVSSTRCTKGHPIARLTFQSPDRMTHYYNEDEKLSYSKIRQARPLELNFRTSEPEEVRHFIQKCKKTTYKTCENVRLDGPPKPD